MTDKHQLSQTHARFARLMVTLTAPGTARGSSRGNSFPASFQENPEGTSSMKSQ